MKEMLNSNSKSPGVLCKSNPTETSLNRLVFSSLLGGGEGGVGFRPGTAVCRAKFMALGKLDFPQLMEALGSSVTELLCGHQGSWRHSRATPSSLR